MTFRSHEIRYASIFGAITVVVVLSGCGGGGGGGMTTMMTPTQTPTQTQILPRLRLAVPFGMTVIGD